MSREAAVLLIAAVAVVLLLLMGWGWYRLSTRDKGLVAPQDVPTEARLLLRKDVLYVATTKHGRPLERLAVRPLAYRSRATVDVTDAGIALALTGKPVVFVPADRITGSGRTTVAIDRVVEPDGLVYFTWNVAPQTDADTILRFTDGGAEDFLRALATAYHFTPSPAGDAS